MAQSENPLSIEDQIDEYLAYKRGLSKTNQKDPCADYGYPDDLDRRPEMKKLFYVLRNATREEINQVTILIETFKGVSL